MYVGMRRGEDALSVLKEIPFEGPQTVGPELQGQVHYWRGQAFRALGDAASAVVEENVAQELLQDLQMSLPERYQAGFAARRDIPLSSHQAVRTERIVR